VDFSESSCEIEFPGNVAGTERGYSKAVDSFPEFILSKPQNKSPGRPRNGKVRIETLGGLASLAAKN